MATAVRGRKRRMPSTQTRAMRNALRRAIKGTPPELFFPEDWQYDLITPLTLLQQPLPTTEFLVSDTFTFVNKS